jgi:hypothetical protein
MLKEIHVNVRKNNTITMLYIYVELSALVSQCQVDENSAQKIDYIDVDIQLALK